MLLDLCDTNRLKIRAGMLDDEKRKLDLQFEEEKRKKTEKIFQLKAYGHFLQCIPIPGRDKDFLTIQGKPRLYNQVEKKAQQKASKEVQNDD